MKTESNRERKEKLLGKILDKVKDLRPDRLEKLIMLLHSMAMPLEKQVLSIKEAADMLNVHADTIRRAIKSGKITAFQLRDSGSWRISRDEIDRYIKR